MAETANEMFVEERLYIAGKLREAAGGRTMENINPATEAVMGVAADADAADMDEAIGAARGRVRRRRVVG